MWQCPNCGEKSENNFDVCWNCKTVNPEATAHILTSTKPESVGDTLPPTEFQHSEINESSPNAQNPKKDSFAPTFDFFSGLLILLTLFFTVKGLFALNAADGYLGSRYADVAIVDVTRALASICVGIVCSVLSVTFAVFAHRAKMSLKRSVE